jgi:hypothetical protein
LVGRVKGFFCDMTRVVGKSAWRGMLCLTLLSQVLVPSPGSAAASASTGDGPRVSSLNAGDNLIQFVSGVIGGLGFNAISDTRPASTHDLSPSTPWTAFAGGVNVVGGNLVLQSTDLATGAIGLGTVLRHWRGVRGHRPQSGPVRPPLSGPTTRGPAD